MQIIANAAMRLLIQAKVIAVQLAHIPPQTSKLPYSIGATYRLLLVVDEELARMYMRILAEVAVSPVRDYAVGGRVWTDDRKSILRRKVLGLLDLREGEFCSSFNHTGKIRIDKLLDLLDVALVPHDWPTGIDRVIRLTQQNCSVENLLIKHEWDHAARTYRIFDPTSCRFLPVMR